MFCKYFTRFILRRPTEIQNSTIEYLKNATRITVNLRVPSLGGTPFDFFLAIFPGHDELRGTRLRIRRACLSLHRALERLSFRSFRPALEEGL